MSFIKIHLGQAKIHLVNSNAAIRNPVVTGCILIQIERYPNPTRIKSDLNQDSIIIKSESYKEKMDAQQPNQISSGQQNQIQASSLVDQPNNNDAVMGAQLGVVKQH